ncbi:hypothetical protein SCWH03_53540 [Streptomyces pacificus]|uniref:Uncharacterized protein n=1 Tax=Streptomyces pacificus TaxID=2705029 RepID=A0A6A0B1F4_9ACTN|nr:hypothetical protein SCWH03_53540 [Streptomyces pacificus]
MQARQVCLTRPHDPRRECARPGCFTDPGIQGSDHPGARKSGDPREYVRPGAPLTATARDVPGPVRPARLPVPPARLACPPGLFGLVPSGQARPAERAGPAGRAVRSGSPRNGWERLFPRGQATA